MKDLQHSSKRLGRKYLVWESLIFLTLYALLMISHFDDDRFNCKFTLSYEIITFSTYVLASLIINYLFVPQFFNKKRYFEFTSSIILLLIFVVLLEEFVLEQIFWPDSLGEHFRGFFTTIVDFGAYVLIPVGLKFVLDLIRKEREMDQLKSIVQESELQRLKSQINPHFLFNNLNNIYSLALENSPKSPEMILRLSNIMRYVLRDENDNFIALDLEVEHLKDYVALSELQIEGRGEIHFNCQGDTAAKKIAPNLLSVFIENAIKHSSSGLSSGILISIDISIVEDQLVFTIKNNFGERNIGANTGHGIGIENVKQRLKLLYPGKHEFVIKEEGGLYEVYLILNL